MKSFIQTKQILQLLIFQLIMLFSLSSLAVSDTVALVHLCYPDSQSPMNNVILSNLAQSLPKIDNKPCLTYQIGFTSEINATNVKTYYKNVKVESIVVFQRFSIRDLLLPIDVTVTLQYFNNTQLIEKKEVKQSLSQNGVLFDYPISAGKKIDRVIVEIQKAELNQVVLDKIVERQQVISDYYTADIQLKLTEEELKQIDYDQLDNIEYYQDITRKAMSVVEKIKAKRFDQSLYLNEYDPVKLMSRLQTIYNQSYQAKSKLVSQIVNIEKEFYKQGVNALQNNDTAMAISYFNQAIDVAPLYALPYVQLASIEIANYNSFEAIKYFQFIDKNLTPDSVAVNESNKLLDGLMIEMLEDAKLLRLQGNYKEAIVQIDSCYSLCKSIRFFQCPYYVDTERMEIYSAMYANIIDQSNIALSNKAYDRFIQWTDSAYQLQSNYSGWLNNRHILFEFMNRAYDELITYGEQSIEINPMASLDALMTSRKLCQSYRELSCSEVANKLISSVFGIIYDQMIDEAFLLFNAQQINAADSLQKKAAAYCKEQNIDMSEKHIELQRLIYQTYYNDIIENVIAKKYTDCHALYMVDSAVLLKKQYNLIGINEDTAYTIAAEKCALYSIGEAERGLILKTYDAVLKNLNRVSQLEQKYTVSLSSSAISRIGQINEALSNAYCQDAKFDIDVQLNSAEIFQQNYEYVFAVRALENAVKLVKQDVDCGFMSDEIEERIQFLKPVAQYQTDWDNVVSDIQSHKFESAIKQLIVMRESYSDSILNQYGLKLQTLRNFIEEYNYVPFTLACIEYLAEQGQTEISLDLLYYLYKEDIDEHLTNNAQDKLGRSLAKRDVALQKGEDTSIAVYKYIKHDSKWFQTMVKSYKKQWKKSVAS